MIKFIISKFWPAFIPVVLYIIWKIVAKKRAQKGLPPPFCSQPEKLVIYSSLAIIIMVFGYIIINHQESTQTYVPSQIIDGKIVPSRIETDD